MEPFEDFLEETRRDKVYLDYIKTLPCICGYHIYGEICPHHVCTGGKALKCSDYETVPLCAKCHREIHQYGREWYEKNKSIKIDKYVIECLSQFIYQKLNRVE